MVSKSGNIDYAKEVESIREAYVTTHLQSRLRTARDLLYGDPYGPAKLVTAVSAVEALARHLTVTAAGGSKAEILARYEKEKYDNPIELVEELVEPADPATYFAEDTWELFGYAVAFRNLVVHECTYVGYDKLHTLVAACEEVFEKLTAMRRSPQQAP